MPTSRRCTPGGRPDPTPSPRRRAGTGAATSGAGGRAGRPPRAPVASPRGAGRRAVAGGTHRSSTATASAAVRDRRRAREPTSSSNHTPAGRRREHGPHEGHDHGCRRPHRAVPHRRSPGGGPRHPGHRPRRTSRRACGRVRRRRHRQRRRRARRPSSRAPTRSSTSPPSPARRSFEEALDTHVRLTHRVLEAAVAHGVGRVVYASSNHAVGFTPACEQTTVDVDTRIRPDSFYGVGKAAAEALCSLYHDRHGLAIACLRIGSFRPRPDSRRGLATWLSPGDAVRLVDACLRAPDLGFAIVYGISANTRAWWDLSTARALGYDPQDDAETYVAESRPRRRPRSTTSTPASSAAASPASDVPASCRAGSSRIRDDPARRFPPSWRDSGGSRRDTEPASRFQRSRQPARHERTANRPRWLESGGTWSPLRGAHDAPAVGPDGGAGDHPAAPPPRRRRGPRRRLDVGRDEAERGVPRGRRPLCGDARLGRRRPPRASSTARCARSTSSGSPSSA